MHKKRESAIVAQPRIAFCGWRYLVEVIFKKFSEKELVDKISTQLNFISDKQ